jgi:hypothetical protein
MYLTLVLITFLTIPSTQCHGIEKSWASRARRPISQRAASSHLAQILLAMSVSERRALCFTVPSSPVSRMHPTQGGHATATDYLCAGDAGKITIGSHSSIKDRAVVSSGSVIGSNVVVGHGAILGAVTVEDGAHIGMGAKVSLCSHNSCIFEASRRALFDSRFMMCFCRLRTVLSCKKELSWHQDL